MQVLLSRGLRKAILTTIVVVTIVGCWRKGTIIEAARSGDVDVATRALAGGESIEQRDQRGNTPLAIASSAGHYRLVSFLVRHRAQLNARNQALETPLSQALGPSGDAKVVRCLIDAGADVNASDQLGITPLMEASSWDDVTSVSLLLAHGADPNAADRKGRTALMHVGKSGEESTAKVFALLIQGGARVNVQGKDGGRSLAMAHELGCQRCVELLLKAGAM